MSLSFLTFEGAGALREQASAWDDLLRRAAPGFEAPALYLERAWLEPWVEHRGEEGHFLFAALVERESHHWLAAMPLWITTSKAGGAKALQMVAAGFPDSDCVFVPAVSESALQTFLRKLLHHWRKNLGKTVSFDLRELPQDGATERTLAAWNSQNGGQMLFQSVAQSPLLHVADLDSGDSNGDAQANAKAVAKTGGKLGRNLRRRLRLLEDEGEARFDFRLVGIDELETYLQQSKSIEDQSWKGEEDVGVLRDPQYQFMRQVWRNYAAQKRLAWGGLKLNGRDVAYHWGLVRDGVFLSYNLAHLPEVNKLSPGTLLLDHMIHHCADLGIHAFDASRGGLDHDHILAPYKGSVRYHRRAVIFRKSVVGRMLEWRLKRFIAEREGQIEDRS